MSEISNYPVYRRRRKRLFSRIIAGVRRAFLRFILAAILIAFAPFGLILLYTVINPPTTMVMISERLSGTSIHHQWRPLSEISERLRLAVISSEDANFCLHDGVEWETLNEMVDGYLDGERVRGASTIPMQTVKNLFLWTDRSVLRKGLEVPLALFADWVWTKERMLEIYLNIAEWDRGIFGAPAAANHYFSKDIEALRWREAALLAVSLPNPKERNPANPSGGLNRLAQRIEQRTLASGDWLDCARDSALGAIN